MANEETYLPDHLVYLSSDQWAVWRWVGLRGAGFPVQQVLKLSAPQCVVAADRLFQAEERAQRARDEALKAVMEDLGTLQRNLEWDNWEKRKPLLKAKHSLEKSELPQPLNFAHTGSVALEAFRNACVQLDSAQTDLYQTFDTARDQTLEAIREIARTDRFCEAIIWQNRRAFHTGIKPLLQRPIGASRSRERQKEEMVALYLQRYCTKNDTIGFFGPVSWARVVDHRAALNTRPGATLLAKRTVYFEGWCIDALAETLAQDETLLPWLAPRRMPQVGVDGTTLYLPFAPPIRLSPAQAAVLRACDGERTAKELAADLVKNPANGLKSEADVFTVLREMRSQRRIVWTLEVPAEGLHPERHLRQRLARIEDKDHRKAVLEALGELEAARSAVTDAAGDSERLDCALENLDVTFTHLTGATPTRRAGETYAGRTLVYEDCQRDIEVTLGSEFLTSLGPPLTLLLTSARWFMSQASVIYRKACREIYAELVQRMGTRTIDFASFWLWGQSLILGEDTSLINSLESMLQKRWADILFIPAGRRHLEYTSQDLRPRVLETFAALCRGWSSARYISPDVMIAAPSLQAIRAGQYQCIMGEMHLDNTLATAVLVAQHPSPSELLQVIESDLPDPRVVLMISRTPKDSPTARLRNALISPKDLCLMYAHDSCDVPASQALPIGMLVIEDAGGTLKVRTRDGRQCFDIIELLGDSLTTHVIHRFNIVPPSSHTPRISFDRLVVCREAWQFTPKEVSFAWDKQEDERFLNAQRWRRARGMPRFVFVRTSPETNPFYVDFASPVFVNVFAKAIRQAAKGNSADVWIKVTEMLPTPDQTWLTDSAGQRYTCEFRIVAVDV